MMTYIFQFFSWLNRNKGKFVLTIFSTLLFLVLLFPFDDLSDLVSSQVSKMTNNQVYLKFDQLRLSLFPGPGMTMKSVYMETPAIPGLRTQELSISPSLTSLISQKPAGTLTARGFLRGDVEVSMTRGTKSDNGAERQKIVLKAQNLNLSDLKEVVEMPVPLRGQLNATSNALIDLSFGEQPDMDLILTVNRFELPSSNVETMMGPLMLPELKLTSVELKGRLSAGRFLIENGMIGKPGDEVVGTIKGNMGMTLKRQGDFLVPTLGDYTLDVDLSLKKSFQDKANLFLTFIDAYKVPQPDGAQYRFKVSSGSMDVPPSIGALR